MLDINFTQSTLPPSQQQDLLTLLHDYLFASSAEFLGHTVVVRHVINTQGPPHVLSTSCYAEYYRF